MQVSRLTGGQVYKYTYFQADLDGERFIADLRHNISRWGFISYLPVLRIRIRIRIHMFLGLLHPDPDPLVRGMDPDPDPALDPDPDPSIIIQK
jgi:hypothetical protein